MAFFSCDVALDDNNAKNDASRVDIFRCDALLLLPRGLGTPLDLSPNRIKRIIEADRAAARAALSGPR